MKPLFIRLSRWCAGLMALPWLVGAPALQAQSTGLLREVFTGIPGNDVAELVAAPSFPDSPNLRQVITDFFETPRNFADNYGQRLRGYLVAPQTGDYVFWIASDDGSVLYLSPDDDPDRKRVIASTMGATSFRNWFAEPNQESAPIRLEAGRYYYVEALMKEGGGSDHLSVRWSAPLIGVQEPMPATYFVPFGTALYPPEITRQPASIQVTEGQPATFVIGVRNSDPVSFQWQRGNAPITGAQRSSYTLERATMADDGARFRCTVANALGFALSEEAVLTVLPDRTPPTIRSVFNRSLTNLVVQFSEPVATNTALVAANYLLDRGATVAAVRAGTRPDEVLLATSSLVAGTEYLLSVGGVTDRAAQPNPVAPGSGFRFVALALTPEGLGIPSLPGTVQAVPGGLDIGAAGRGLAGTNDQAHFSYESRTGDFDVEVRLGSFVATSAFAQAGIMARENLAAGSAFVATLTSPGPAGSSFLWRASTNGPTAARGSFPVNYPDTWLRLRRAGTNFTGFASYDGATWTLLGTVGLGWTNSVYLGLVVDSRSTNEVANAAFRDYANSAAKPEPGGLPDAVEPLGPSSRRTGLVISEILYHAPDRADGRPREYVEIHNADSIFVNLGGYRLDGDVRYVFPEGTVIPAGGFLVVAASPADVAAESGLDGVLGPWTGQLARGNGFLQLRNRTGAVLLEVAYSDEPPWPVAADGAGHSLVLARPSYGEGDVRAWAASEWRGGSPGRREPIVADPRRRVVINEWLAHTDDPDLDFVELFNHGSTAVDLSGCVLTDDPTEERFRIPDGLVLAPGGYIAWNQLQLGFALSAAGEAIYLIAPGGRRVIDAVRFGPQANGVAGGRTPNGAGSWQALGTPTPGAPNTAAREDEIVINEIMYHPPVGGIGEYLELFNRGNAPVNLKDWRLTEGVTFAFTNDVVMPPGGYLVVAADAAYLLASYPALAPERVVGNYSGNLSNGGERLTLAKPELLIATNAAGRLETNRVFVTVDEVRYRDGGRWGRWSDGGGSSLELVDARADNGLAANWADSDETGKASWTTIDFTGLLELGLGESSELQVMLLGAGECLLDDVQVLNAAGANLVGNPGFEGGISGWLAQGNHVATSLSTNIGARSLHLRASAGGDNGANRVKTRLAGGLTENGFATLRARVRWLRGHPDLLLRLKGNYLETLATLNVPANLGTPGAPNSRRVANAGPAIVDVSHSPVLPAALQPVRVTARVQDPDGVGSVRLRFRFDPSISERELAMRDDGRDGDLVPGDGVYSALIPGQASGVLVAFRIEAGDDADPSAKSTFPEASASGECLVRFGDEVPAGSFGTYRLWMTQRNTDLWTEREYMSNEALDGTIVYGSSRAIYNGGARYRGSPFIRPGYSGPTGSLCAYVWTVPPDELLLGSDEFNLDWLEQPGRDATLQRERLSFWVGEQLGVPFSHTRYIQVYVNGVRRGEVYTDSQQPNSDYITSWFPGADDGFIYKIDDWFEFDDFVNRELNVDARLERYANSDGRPHKTRYRWNWERKANRGLDDDYSPVLDLVEALNLPDGELYDRRVPQLLDPDGWLRTIATRRVVADWDGYGYGRGKNTFAYVPPGGRWHLLLWDLDFSLGGGSDGTSRGIFDADDPVMERVYANPFLGRVYLQAISDAVRGPLAQGVADPVMDAHYAAFVGNHVNAASPTPIKSWIAARRSFLARVLSTNTEPWSITQSGGPPVVTDESVVTLTGTAPIEVRTITVNGQSYPPIWLSRTRWALNIPLRAGTNRLALAGVDLRGRSVTAAAGAVEVVFTGEDERPEDFVRISEIQYEPADPDAEFVEIHNASRRTTYDLSGWQLDGVDYVFPGGTALRPGAYLVVVKDRLVFEAAHGPGVAVVGEYPGRLNNAGETLRLRRPGTASQPWVVVAEVTYSNRAPWPDGTAFAGGSLQLLDPRQDGRRPAQWGAVDAEGFGHSTWQFVSVTERAGSSAVLRLRLAGPGAVRIDDVSLVAGLVPRVGPELVANGGFETALGSTWIPEASAADSFVDSTQRRSGRSSLRLVASEGTGTSGASVTQTLAAPPVSGQFYTLSFWYLADREGRDLSVSLDGSAVSANLDAREQPVAAATPGAESSMATPLAPIPDLWINEVHPAAPGNTDSAWIELVNTGSTVVSLSGWYLSPDPTHPGAWPFPTQASIAPGEFLVVQAGGAGTAGSAGYRTDFPLSPGSGSVVLSRNRNGVPAVVDYLHYANLTAGRSAGSYPDGPWTERRIFEIPTPGGPNDVTALPVRLVFNEWMARNNSTLADPADGDYDDWFELYNAGDQPVDLTGYLLTDDPSQPSKTVVPPGFVVPPKGVLLVWADGEPEQNGPGRELHVDFSLSTDGETLALYSPGGILLDLVDFGPQARDISEGLRPDGAVGSVVRLPSPTPRALNFAEPSDEIRLTGIQLLDSVVTVAWQSVAGGRYQLQSTAALGADWSDVGPPIVAAGPVSSAIDPMPSLGGARFYRVVRR